MDSILLYVADGVLATAGATGNKSHTCNNFPAASESKWGAYLIGLKPASGVTLTADAGAYALTGTAAGFAGATNLASGAYTITGATAGFARGLTAAAGSYTISGTAAAFRRTHTAAAGAYNLTGSPATFIVGANVVLPAAAGAYTITGSAASFIATANLVFPAAAGAYSLTGSAAAFISGGNAVLPTDPGSYTVTGTAAAFITTSVVPVLKATVTVTGKTVTIRDTSVVPVAAATVLFAGKTVTIQDLILGIPVGKADILFTGQNVAISTTGEQPPLVGGGGGVTVPPWRDLGRKKRRRYRALEEIEKRLDQRIERLTAEARQIGEVVPRQTGELVPVDVLSQTVVVGQIDVLSHQDLLRRQAQINQMLHEAQRRAEKVRQERIELDRLARIASEEADDEEAIAMLMRFL